MDIEYEVRVLEINKEEIIKKLEELNAEKIFESIQKRYVYDFKPKEDKKWIRLRTNKNKTTLTIKEVKTDKIDGTEELEIQVNDFEKTNMLLNQLGYISRNYQENYRIQYILDNVEIDIDTWPLIPTYMEVEGPEEEIYKVLDKLGIDKSRALSLDVESIYNTYYKIDIGSIKDLRFQD